MHPCWLPPLPFLVSPKDRREEMTVHSNCKAWSSSPPTILGCRSYLLLRPLWLAQRESLSIPSVYMLEPLTSSHQNCFKYLLMGNNRWSLKATWKQRFWWWESSSRSLYFKAPLYTDPTHTIRKAWVCACFQVLIPREGIKHEQIGRMTGSLSCFTWQSIFWHLPTSDQPGFTHFGARLFFRFALERTIRWTWWGSGAWPFCWRPGPLESRNEWGRIRPQDFTHHITPASDSWLPCLKSAVKVECISPLTFLVSGVLQSTNVYALFYIIYYVHMLLLVHCLWLRWDLF